MNDRRRLIGVVRSDKMQETVVVEISRTFRHPLYKKVVHTSKRVKARDILGCKVGDEVQIVESRPYSADTRFVVETIIKRHGESAVVINDNVELEKLEQETAELEAAEQETDEQETDEQDADEDDADEQDTDEQDTGEGAQS